MIHRILDKVCKRLDIALLYESKVGIKCCNQLISSSMFKHHSTDVVMEVPSDQLLLCVDNLKDPYTLIDTKIIDSPHYELVQTISKGQHIAGSAYVKRRALGTLDAMSAVKVNADYLRNRENSLRNLIDQIKAGFSEPVMILRLGDACYLSDGKHRAAIHAYLGLPIKCVDATGLVFDSFFWWNYRKMLRSRANYRKQIAFYERMYSNARNSK